MNTTHNLRRALLGVRITCILTAVVLLLGKAFAAESIGANTQAQIASLLVEKESRTPAQRKLDSQLIYFSKQTRNQAITPAVVALQTSIEADAVKRVLVDIKATVSQPLLDFIAASGGLVVNEFAAFDAIRAQLPVGFLETLAARRDVRFVAPAGRAQTNLGSVTSQGDRTHRADTARTDFRTNGGSGVKIGVMSDGVDSLAASIASGNLNPNTTVISGQAGSGDEGTAMMEIVQDLAPNAQIYFATAFNGPASFASNILALQAAGCTVIVDDVTYFNESPFQDQQISQAVNTVSAAGVMYFSSARNSGSKDKGTSGTWEGDFADGGAAAVGSKAGRLHDFGGAVTFDTVNSGGSSRRVDLFWADPVGASTNDYDLFVTDAAGAVLRSSTNIQSGTQDPYESTGTLNVGERIVIVKTTAAASRFLHLDTGRGVIAISTPGNVRGHNAAGAANAFSVAATDVNNSPSPNFFVGGASNPVEGFSSDGPRRIFFNPNGTAITPGNFSSTGGTVLQKPDFTAADGGATSVSGFTTFYGTSAAAPHAAAIAALIKSYNPALTPAQIRSLLSSTALDIEGVGYDRDSGSGIIMARAAIQAAPVPPTAIITLPPSVMEGGAAGSGTVTINPVPTSAVTVNLTNSTPTRLTIPASVVVSGGQASVNFSVSAVNDALLNGSPSVSVNASAAGYTGIPANITVIDNETTTLSVTLPATAAEGAPGLTGTVTTAANVGANVAVSLSSNDLTELTVPATVTILSGQNSAAFPLTIVDDGIVDGTQTPTITAQVTGWTSGSGSMLVTDVGARNFLTELFDDSANDTAGATYTFVPIATSSGYTATRGVAAVFPTDPTGGTAISADDDTSTAVTLSGGALVKLFGVSYGTLYAGSNGYLTFGSGDTQYAESVAAHYTLPRISALFDDLDFSAGGTLTYRQLGDRVAVTWQNVPEYATTNSNSFQIQMFFDGRITITILSIVATDGLIGVSPGGGVPANFVETDFSALGTGFIIGPTVSSIANQTILEDQPTIALAFTVSDDRTASSSLIVSALSSNTTLVPVGSIAFGGSGANRTVTVSPAANQIGSTTITMQVTDGDGNTTSVPFSVTVTAVNDAPSFTRGSSQIVLEDAAAQTVAGWATALSAGPANEVSQVLNFIVSNSNNALFSVQPTVAANGTLTFTPAANASGSAIVSVQIHDNGGTANGGVDTSAVQTFTIAVTAVNDVPAFTKGANQSVLEDAGARTVAAWATAISAGAADESAQALDFIVSNTNNALFSTQPAVAANGTLTFTPAANASGSAILFVQIHDNGGTASGGSDTSAAQTFTITVTAVNDAPRFTKGADQSVLEDSAARTVVGWASALSAGPADESGQVLDFIVSNTNNALFSAQPSITVNGTLTYAPAPNANGNAIVTVQLHDNGGTAGGGVDTSAAQTFSIVVDAVNDAPTLSAIANPAAILEDAPGMQTIDLSGISTGSVNESQVLTITAASDNPALIATPSIAYTSPGGTGLLSYAPAANMSGTATITVRVQDDGGTANGGVDAVTQTFTVTVTGVNDAPSFTRGPDSTVLEDAGAQMIPGWAGALSAGPADENGQSLNFIVSNDNASLFASAPAISPGGALSFTTASDANGTATVTVKIHDDGGTLNGGADTSAAQTFTINVTPVNDPPTLNALAPMTVAEDAAQQSVPLAGIGTGAANEVQTLVVTATSSDPAIIAAPAIDFTSPNATGTLRFTPVANANGSATITVTVNDGGAENPTTTRTFTVGVTAVNDAPVFTKGSDQTVNEDSETQTVAIWAGGVSAGPHDEAAQALDFSVSNDNAALFTSPPTLSATGALSYSLAPDANGFATVTVLLHDDGGTANGGVDTSAPQTFTITVVPVNDPPSFLKGADQSARQNAGAQRVPGWATNLSAGPADESGQALDFIVSNDNPALFSVPPAIGPDGALTFTPAADASGTATVTVMLHDNGGTAPGIDTSAAQTFLISTTFVNDAPSFTAGGDQSAAEETGPQTIAGWASAISPGPADEAAQAVNFILDVNDSTIFTTAPTIAPDGTLTFTPRPGASGSSIVTVRLHDNGGTADGGVDTSDPVTFTIFVTSFREETGTYNGLVRAPDSAARENRRAGLIRVTLAKSGVLTGKLVLGGVSYAFKGSVDNGGVAHFGRDRATSFALVHRGQPARSLSLKIDVARGTDTLTGEVSEGAGAFAKIDADRALFSSKKNPVAPLMNVASDLLGKYTVLFAAKSPAEEGRDATTFPQGDGFGFVKVLKSGVVKLTGTLADGTKISCSNALSKNRTWPFYVRLASGGGSLSSPITFRPQPDISDLDGLDLDWFKPMSSHGKRYTAGWPTGIHPDLIGAKYTKPATSENRSVLPGLALSAPAGNATVTLTGADLPPAGIVKTVNIDPKNKVSVVAPGSDKIELTISGATGGFHGEFKDPLTRKTLIFKGAILQSQQLGSGFFLTPTGSGAVTVEPQL